MWVEFPFGHRGPRKKDPNFFFHLNKDKMPCLILEKNKWYPNFHLRLLDPGHADLVIALNPAELLKLARACIRAALSCLASIKKECSPKNYTEKAAELMDAMGPMGRDESNRDSRKSKKG